MQRPARLLTPLFVLVLGLGGPAGATEIRLGLNSSAGLGCQVGAARVGLQTDRVGLYAQAGYCSSNLEGQSGSAAFGLGLNVDLFRAGNFTTYALAGADIQSGNSVVHGGLGVRYGLALLPVEGYLEAGVQRINTSLQPVYGPRVAVGLNYRVDVGALQGTIPAPLAMDDPSASRVQYAGSAPAACNLSAEQDVALARGAATSAANDGLSAAASAYASVYSGVSYKVTITGVSIDGGAARVSGTVSVGATQRSNGERVSGTYGGTISLVREGCGWRATGYVRS